MNVGQFLKEVVLPDGYAVRTQACAIIGAMSQGEFEDFCRELKMLLDLREANQSAEKLNNWVDRFNTFKP